MTTTRPMDGAVRLGGADAHRFLLGVTNTMTVVQQAYRLTSEHSDELLLLNSGRDYWVAARLGDRTSVWACHDLDAAEDTFEDLTSSGPSWTASAPSRTSPAA